MFASLAKFATLLLAAASAAQASPVKRAALDVWTPAIIEPTLGSVWPVGTVQTLVWSLDTIPESAYGTPGSAYLGYYEDGSDSEHLDLSKALAKDFTYGDGQVNITVPDVPTKDTYIIALFGDSGNVSKNFTITTTQ